VFHMQGYGRCTDDQRSKSTGCAGNRAGQEQRSGAKTGEDHGGPTRCLVHCMAQEVVPYRCMVYARKV
jgi:hypothetical protein